MENELNKILDVCPYCRFPLRISGMVFLNKDAIELIGLEELRCPICKHLPDYKIVGFKEAKIIYRSFNGSDEYFNKVIECLESKDFKVINKPHSNSEEGE